VTLTDVPPHEVPQIPGYEILGPIGRGSMGEVVLARQLALGRDVAIKFMDQQVAADPEEAASRFRREAELMARVAHPNIVTIFDFGVASGRPYLVMEYIEGGDLRREMAEQLPIPVARLVTLLRPIVNALEHLHRKGILHRDLKPENVLMQEGDTPKVADFGIAVSGLAIGMLTQPDVSMGTVGYVAPEQLYRLKVDERADQFSLAAIAYELLTGSRPLGVFPQPTKLNRALRPEVDAVVMRGLSEDREDRYLTVREFGDALEEALTGPGGLARRRLSRLAAAVTIAAVVFVVVVARPWRHAGGPKATVLGDSVRPLPLLPPDPLPGPITVRASAPWVNSLRMSMVPVPVGEFVMGAPKNDPDARAGERPAHRVTLARPFSIGAHEVTVGQFRVFVTATNYRTEAETDGVGGCMLDAGLGEKVFGTKLNWRNPGYPNPQADDEPVVQVSWNDAMAFCKWLSEQERRHYRLPTEAEWEYACRAGTTTRWASGDSAELLDAIAWTPKSDVSAPRPVGRKAPNAFGLFDMHGNVWEWCLDRYGPYRPGPEINPHGPTVGNQRVLRGGAWDRKKLRRTTSTYRSAAEPEGRFYTYGFRVCQPSAP
jgi:formylglycine-generating enzyme required for sulfatase activity